MSETAKGLWGTQNGKCFWCADQLNPIGSNPDHKNAPTLDHVKAKSVKAKYEKGRTVLACRDCNKLRGTYNVQYWQKLRIDLDKISEENKRLNDLLIKYLEQPWWRKVYVHFFRFLEFLKEHHA